jgi:hypothetical protein
VHAAGPGQRLLLCIAELHGTEVGYVIRGTPTPKYAFKYVPAGSNRFPVTGRHLGPIYSKNPSTGACQESSFSDYDLYDVGPEVPASAFVQGTITTSP